jgi:hypothetical protein
VKHYLIAVAALCVAAPAYAAPKLGICHDEYALCASSSTEATGKTIRSPSLAMLIPVFPRGSGKGLPPLWFSVLLLLFIWALIYGLDWFLK